MPLPTPVALFLYRRPELTARVFARIAEARPTRLLLVADGPKNEADQGGCLAARAVVERVDWPCEVERAYAEANLGLRARVASGLDWVFARAPEAIILEDDCVPHPSFFSFCATMLQRYREDERVMGVAGGNYQGGRRRSSHSYYFSAYPSIWGWATWARAWRHYDLGMGRWPELRDAGFLESVCGDAIEAEYWRDRFDDVYHGRMTSTWDYQWVFAIWSQRGLFVTPEVNLVSNVGFGAGATHTSAPGGPGAAVPALELGTLSHPAHLYRHREADRHFFDTIAQGRRLRGPLGWLRRSRDRWRRRALDPHG